jgi:DNA-binding response OmpR family regulator
MSLNCLLLTSDVTLLEVMRTGFSAMSVELEMRSDAASAIELSARRHLDGFVIDCDDVERATDLLAQIRNSRSNKLSIVFAVVNATTSVSMAIEAGANFVLGKPVQDNQLRSLLDTALRRMEREHRRYFRHKVDLHIELFCQSGEAFAGKIMNVSEDGLALTRFGFSSVEGVVTVRFGLPSANPQIFQAKTEVVWNDAYAMGLRFLRIEPGCRSGFAAWLDSLEAQLQFRESTKSSNAILGERRQGSRISTLRPDRL